MCVSILNMIGREVPNHGCNLEVTALNSLLTGQNRTIYFYAGFHMTSETITIGFGKMIAFED